MASDLRLRIGGASTIISLNGDDGQFTDQQVAAVLTRFMEAMAIPTTGTNVENMTAYLNHVKDETRRVAKARHRRQLQAEQDAIINSTVETENNL